MLSPRSRLSIINTVLEKLVNSLDRTCQPNGTTTKAASGPHHLSSLVSADMVGLIGDISCSLHSLGKKGEKRKNFGLPESLKR